MKKYLSIAVMVFCIFLCGGHGAFAQWDRRGCSDYGINLADARSLESSLWTFRSNVWDGYIDFMEDGKYWTHWGMGTWAATPEGGIHMANDYNQWTYELVFGDNGFQFQGIRNDGLKISGKLLCAKYEGPGPQVPEEIAESIKGLYRDLLARGPDIKELQANFRQYNQGMSLDAIREGIMQTPEYAKKAAARAASAPADGEILGW